MRPFCVVLSRRASSRRRGGAWIVLRTHKVPVHSLCRGDLGRRLKALSILLLSTETRTVVAFVCVGALHNDEHAAPNLSRRAPVRDEVYADSLNGYSRRRAGQWLNINKPKNRSRPPG
jgi:hypothetical protein